MSNVFVYGTLRKEEGLNHILEDSNFLGTTTVKGTLIDLGAYPGLILTNTQEITGEVYEVDESTLDRLDQVEGCPHLYRREALQSEEFGDMYVYIWNRQHDNFPTIESGDWKKR